MSDPIDYSRPVGWWCPVCGASGNHFGRDDLLKMGIVVCCTRGAADEMCFTTVIPRYLPIPEGQRPPAASEVEEAEVVTFHFDGDDEMVVASVHPRGGTMGVMRWSGFSIRPIEVHINDCATTSARARIVTGATE